MTDFRIGHGYDAHRFCEGRPLVLGGITVPHEKGLLGHSDADVLLHAIMDAMLGAAALGDIGHHFPDTDDTYKGANSLQLFSKTIRLLKHSGCVVTFICSNNENLSNCNNVVEIIINDGLRFWENSSSMKVFTNCKKLKSIDVSKMIM